MAQGTVNYTEMGFGLHQAIAASGNRLWFDNASGSWLADDAIAVQAIINGYDPLSDARTVQIALINAACQVELGEISAAYPPLEIATWDQQLSEAQAWTADNAAPTPILSAIIAVCGSTMAAFVASVLANSTAYVAASGAAIGKRRQFTALISTASSVDAVQAIVWS